MTVFKVGQLAARVGLTVRTLHHYDEIGLLTPSQRTRAGHRLYGAEDVRRLQRIASLRHRGLPLDEIRRCLEHPEYSLDRVLELQMERIDEQLRHQASLRKLIERLRARLASAENVSVEELIESIEVSLRYETYYSADQLARLEARREEVGSERMEAVQEEWTDLFADFARALDDGLDPDSPEVKLLARRASSLIEEFTGGDPGITRSLDNLYRAEGGPDVMLRHGIEMPDGLWEYMGKARDALTADAS